MSRHLPCHYHNEECYVQRIQPLLRAKKVREIAQAIRVSELYAGLIRSGKRRPHARHWNVLADLGGFKPDQVLKQ